MNTELLGDIDATLAATARVLAAPVDVVVLTTGIGVRSWFEAAASAGLDEQLRAALAAPAASWPADPRREPRPPASAWR